MNEQVDRVVDRLANQRDAEAESDPVYDSEAERHRGDSRESAGDDRDETEKESGDGAIYRQQQEEDEAGAEQGKTNGFVLDGRARGDGKHAGAAHFESEPRGGCAGWGRRPGKRRADGFNGLRLSVRIGASRSRLRDDQGAVAVLGNPHTLSCSWRLPAAHVIDDIDHLAGRILRQQFFDQHAGGRGEQIERVLDRGRESIDCEPLGSDSFAQRVAMLEEILAIPINSGCLSVADRCEACIGA